MDKKNIIRAWKDPEYRASLTEAPESPAGAVELDDAALESIVGGKHMLAPAPMEASYTNTNGCTVSGVTVKSCGYICTYTTECGC